MQPVDEESRERGDVGGQDHAGQEAHPRFPLDLSTRRGVPGKLLAAAALCGAALAAAAYGPAAHGAGLAAAVSSPLFYLGLTAACAASLWAAHVTETGGTGGSRRSFWIIVGSAAAFRLVLLPAAPALSDDVYRYLWDGHVQAHGFNPYAMAPADPALDLLETSYRGRINNPGLPTIYPPVSQIAFLLASLAPGGIAAMKLLVAACDMVTILALAAILRRRGEDPSKVVIYAWSPLAVIEVGWSGHNDPVGVCLLALAALAIIGGAPRLSICAAALSGAAKYVGLLALPALAKRSRAWTAAAAPAVLAAAYAPYASAGWGVLGSLPDYLERWRFNDSIFSVLLALVDASGLAGLARRALLAAGWLDPSARWDDSLTLRLIEPLSIAKAVAAGIFLAFAARVLRRGWEDPAREIAALVGAALILSPTLHPWYLLWIAPFLAVVPRLSWTWLTFAAPLLAYPMLSARTGDADPLRWLALVEYLPFFLILAVESARRRLWEQG